MPAVRFAVVPPSNHVVAAPAAVVVVCQRGLMPGPRTISRPLAGRMFIAHIRVGSRLDGAPAILIVSPTLRFSGVASVRRKILSELDSMSHVIAFPLESVERTVKWT